MERRNIFFIDQTSQNDHHMVFNASIIKILQQIYNLPVIHYGISTNQESVFQLLNKDQQDRVVLKPINYNIQKSQSFILKVNNYLKKEIIRYKTFKSILKGSDNSTIIFLSITTFTSFLGFKLLKRKYDTKTVAFLHGDIDFLYNWNSITEQLNGITHKLIFKIKAPNFYYCVLNKICKPQLIKDGYFKSYELLEINHPVEVKNEQVLSLNDGKKLIFGHIGSLEKERKGSHKLYELAAFFEKEILFHNIVFKAIGLATPSVLPFKNNLVEEIVGNKDEMSPKYLERDIYEKELIELNYALFFYPTHEYVFRASGAVTDAIAFNIPLIALKHPIFEYFTETVGNIGYFFDDIHDMKLKIKELSLENESSSLYKIQKENLKKLHSLLSIKTVKLDLEAQLIKRNLL